MNSEGKHNPTCFFCETKHFRQVNHKMFMSLGLLYVFIQYIYKNEEYLRPEVILMEEFSTFKKHVSYLTPKAYLLIATWDFGYLWTF